MNGIGDWHPDGWWRVLAPDGSLWCESSDEDAVRRAARPGDTVQRHERVTHERWMDSP